MSSNEETTTVDKPKKKKGPKPMFWAPECKYSVIMDVATEHGWKLVDEERLQSKVNLYWIDVALIHERFRTILPWQCINHFPGMPNIARKNRMGQNLNRMQKLFPKEYSFYPRTWVLPGELADFRQQFDNNGVALNNKIFIIKPDAGCQGRGIFLTRTLDTVPVSENVVAQVYIKKPLLLDGFKFDLRIYVIVTSVKPLRMYLFHDGLVRMCTEEYVKPTKQNLGMMCMHLTNYAVNKHNENFQQPSASTSEECQDEGSKRSLLWFMNWVRKERGDAKADWLWKRIGVLCTRTLLCIMPTLSREYDQHFKSFAGIPVDMSKIQSPHREGGTVPVKPPTTQGATGSGTVRGRPGRTNLSSSAAEGSKEGSEDEEGNEDDDGAAATQQQASATETTDGGKSASPTNAPPPDDGLPKIRGSRCFEVLGFDIMMDHNLNPWLIEVNHLPSFGTDSPLDRDIKDRLMRQVFSVLPTRGDDYAAYVAHQKVESEKRLISQTKERQAKLEAARQAQQKPLPKAAPRPRPTQSNPNAAPGAYGSNGGNAANENNNNSEDDRSENTGNIAEESQQEDENLCTPERLEEIKKVLLDVYDKHSPEKINKIDRLMGKYIGHEEEFLLFVFAKYGVSPTEYESEVRRQQRLERIRRYREQQQQQQQAQQPPQQSSSSSMAPSNEDGSTADPSSDAGGDGSGGETTHDPDDGGQDEENSGHNQLISGSQDTSSLPSTGIASAGGNGSTSNNNNKAREPNKRYSRSLSPPRSGNNTNNSVASTSTTRGRPVPAWKVGGADEEAQLREEILAMHVPSEDEEWLRFEMARLGQCTRIFPPEPRRANAANDAEDGKEEQEDVDDADETTQANAMAMANGEDSAKLTPSASATSQQAPAAAVVAAAKSATYEEILFHVFLQDRRQTMRLRCPLPNRDPNNVNKDGFLPPLDGPSSSRASFSSMGSGRGVVGWKAPRSNQPIDPKAAANKQPTQQQLEFAKRLSQGLSVSSKSTQNPKRFVRSVGPQSVVTMTTDPSIQYSVVLDPQEYVTNGGVGVGGTGSQASLMGVGSASGGTMAMPQQAAVYANGQEIIWPSTKAHRLYEESRNNRMRIEAARANNGAILRQQVFYFDPNYESYQPALVMGMPPMSDGSTVMAPTSVVVAGGSVVNGGGGGGGGGAERRPSVASEAMMMHQGSSGHQQMLLLQQQQLQQQQQAWKGVGVGARPGVASGGRPANGIVTQVAPGSTGSLMSTNGQTIINGSKPPGMHGGNGSGGGTGNGTGNGVAQQGSKGMYAGGAQPSMGRGNGLPASMQQQQQQQQAAMAGGNATKQEELLRQLFPSWF